MTNAARQPISASLFDVDDLDTMPKVRHMTISSVGIRDVHEFCHRYHYTDTGGNMTWRYGLWHASVLLGVVAYNLPTRRTCESLFGKEHGADHVWHMGRLAVSEQAPRNSESRLIGGSLRLIEKHYPNVWGIITFAATDVGHIGYVYQATNALYTGSGGDTAFYTDANGARRATVLGGHRVSPRTRCCNELD